MAKGWLDTLFSLEGKKIWVAGHNGMVGAALLRRLSFEHCEVLIAPRGELDLRNQVDTYDWISQYKPDVIIIAAAKVGGILANDTYPADFLYDNLMIQNNIIHAAHKLCVEKLLFLGSSCIYPKDAENPITEDALLTGALEPTNEAYAIAKISGVKLCQAYRQQHGCDFISSMPCNLYGVGDSFDAHNSHVIPALMMKAHIAKCNNAAEMIVWGSGAARREFLYVDDLADALVFLLKNYSDMKPINVGSGEDITIADLAHLIAECTGFTGELVFDESKPDGVAQKLMNSSRIFNAGWMPSTTLFDGLIKTYECI
ncbi:MAG: GDP-L-fucose synthase [Alphaproteobacteria bacterium]|nr:GDP-L-fucose synthase [Alphaproteobacteria bacterium]